MGVAFDPAILKRKVDQPALEKRRGKRILLFQRFGGWSEKLVVVPVNFGGAGVHVDLFCA